MVAFLKNRVARYRILGVLASAIVGCSGDSEGGPKPPPDANEGGAVMDGGKEADQGRDAGQSKDADAKEERGVLPDVAASTDVGAEAAVDALGDSAQDGRGDGAMTSDAANEACGDARCGNVTVGVNFCPTLDIFTLSPAQPRVGQVVALHATAMDANGDALFFHWTASVGFVTDPNSDHASYLCTVAGTVTLSVAVSDGHCGESTEMEITCDP
jgi:hypothetical protein